MNVDIAIIGAGHNGLVAAYYLANAGLDVHLFERRPFIGGATITEELFPGFRFSTCAHMIHGIHPKIMRDLDLSRRGLTCCLRSGGVIINPDGTYYAPAEHGSDRNLSLDRHYTDEELAGMQRLNEFTSTLIDIFTRYRLGPPPPLAQVRQDIAGTQAAEVLEQAMTLRISELHERFLPTQRLRDRFSSAGKAVARDPLALHLAYSSIDQPEAETGEKPLYGYPKGGVGTVSRTMCEAAQEAGATIHVDAGVDRIVVEDGRAVGLKLGDGMVVEARAVVSNLDPKRTFLRLMDQSDLDDDFRARLDALKTNVSCTKLLAAIRELPKWKDWDGDPDYPYTGSVVMGASAQHTAAAYDDLDAGRPPRMPVISFSVPSFTDPSLVDGEGHTASIWIYPAPAKLAQGTWDDVREDAAQNIIDRITEYAPNFRDSIIDFKYRTPLDLERENGLTDGCIWHVQHEGEHMFWNRPLPELAAYRAPIAGLYLCGAGQHPGGEVSGLPGHNAAHELLQDIG